jgi:hypothetical protein
MNSLEEDVPPDEPDGHPADGRLHAVEHAAAVHARQLLGAEAEAEQGQFDAESLGQQEALLAQEGVHVVLVGVHRASEHDERAIPGELLRLRELRAPVQLPQIEVDAVGDEPLEDRPRLPDRLVLDDEYGAVTHRGLPNLTKSIRI